jgi:capsid protein
MNWLDRAIGVVAPGTGLRRARRRHAMAVLARAYEGARAGRRTEGWITAGTGANAEIAPALARLRDRSRDLVRNNPYAAKAVQALVSNMVGTGLLPRARATDAEIAGLADRLWHVAQPAQPLINIEKPRLPRHACLLVLGQVNHEGRSRAR